MAVQTARDQHTLMADAVGLGGAFVASIACVAPSSTVAFTLALLASFAGFGSPLAIVVVGAFMIMVAGGYARLNNWKPHAGAPFVWVGEAVAPVLGYATGLLAIMASTVAIIADVALAGTYALGLIQPGGTFSAILVFVTAVVFMGLVTYLAIRGVRPSIEVQTAIVIFEYAVVLVFVALTLKREIIDHVAGTTAPSWNVFLPSTSPTGLAGLIGAGVVCGFLYAGWESPLILGEETKKPKRYPGLGAILGMVFLTGYYAFLVTVFQGLASPADIQKNGTDILAYAGGLLAPDPWGRLLPLAVLSALFGTTQMMLVESSRLTFAMARDRLLPKRLSAVHWNFKTPWVASLVIALLAPLALIPYLANASANSAIGYLLSADGLLYLAMYGIVALACVWYYRQLLTTSFRNFMLSGLFPLIGGVAMIAILAYGLATQLRPISLVAAGILVACLVIAVIVGVKSKATYFSDPRKAHVVETNLSIGSVAVEERAG
ncbi:APC family permease [bacterium]|nr:MAG: APC family permease [bacterium]